MADAPRTPATTASPATTVDTAGPAAAPPHLRRRPVTTPLVDMVGSRRLVRFGLRSWLVIGMVIVAAGSAWALGRLTSIVVPMLIATVIAMLFGETVSKMHRRGIPRPIGAGIVMFGLAGSVAAAIGIAAKGVIDQADTITSQVQAGWDTFIVWLGQLGVEDTAALTDRGREILDSATGTITGAIGSAASGMASGLFSTFIGAFLLFYLLSQWDELSDWVAGHLGVSKELGEGLVSDATSSVRHYFIGLTVASILVSALIGLAVHLLGLPLAFSIALVTLVTSYVPYLGAIISGVFACLVALGTGGVQAAVVILVVLLVSQNLVQTVVQTKLTSNTLNVHPIVILSSTIVGATIAGVLGATLSAPVVAMLIRARGRMAAAAAAEEAMWAVDDAVTTSTDADADPTPIAAQ